MVALRSLGIEVIGDGVGDGAGGVAQLARRLDASDVTYWVIGAERGEAPDVTRSSLDPSLLATVAARHTHRLGLVIAAAGHRDHPYNLARRLVSADHAAGGRIGWLAMDFDHRIGLNAATDTWTGADLDAKHAADAVAAVRTLCRTWPLDSVVGDAATGVFADTARIKRADVTRGYRIAGPLNVPGSRQHDLPVWQQGGAEDTGAADVVIVEEGQPVPKNRTAVVRVRSIETIDAALPRIAETAAAGVLVRVAARHLTRLLDEVLPRARRRGALAGPTAGSLRERLQLPAPDDPWLSGHAIAFPGVPDAGARL